MEQILICADIQNRCIQLNRATTRSTDRPCGHSTRINYGFDYVDIPLIKRINRHLNAIQLPCSKWIIVQRQQQQSTTKRHGTIINNQQSSGAVQREEVLVWIWKRLKLRSSAEEGTFKNYTNKYLFYNYSPTALHFTMQSVCSSFTRHTHHCLPAARAAEIVARQREGSRS